MSSLLQKIGNNIKLPSSEEEAYKLLNETYKDQILNVAIHQNHGHHDVNASPEGMTIKFKKGTKLYGEPFGYDWFGIVAAVKISEKDKNKYTDQYYVSKLKELNEGVHQLSQDDTSGPNLRENRDTETNKDKKQWKHGIFGGYAGLVKVPGTRRDEDYYLIVHTNAGLAGYELYKIIEDHEGEDIVNIDTFVRSKEYEYVRNVSKRNALRILADMAVIFDVEIATEVDNFANGSNSIKKAKPDILCEYNMIDAAREDSGYVYYNNCFNLDTCQGGLIFSVDPYYGSFLYCGSAQVSKGTGMSNKFNNSFPIGTGKIPLNERKLAEFSKKEKDVIQNTYTWSGKKDNEIQYRFNNIYRGMNKNVEEINELLGQKDEFQLKQVVPIVMKLGNL